MRHRQQVEATATRQILGGVILAAGVFIVLAVGWVAWRTYQAYQHLSAAQQIVTQAKAELASVEMSTIDSLAPTVDRLRRETSSAHAAVNDPLYRAATIVPWLGPNLETIRQVALSLDDVATHAVTTVTAVEPLASSDQWAAGGSFDLEVLTPVATSVVDLDTSITHAREAMLGVDNKSVAGPVARAANEYIRQLTDVSERLSSVATTARLALPMLGAEGPRTYLVAFQNLAETRPTGGIFGFYALLRVDSGRLTLGDAGSTDRDLGVFDQPVKDLPAGLTDLYWPGMAKWPQAVNFSPSFPRAAELLSAMFTSKTGQDLDGVLSIDPVVVAELLRGVAPISLGNGLTLSADTAVSTLLSDIYTVFPGGDRLAERDDLMRSTMTEAFSAVLASTERLSASELLAVTKDLADQRRILLWSAHQDEQSIVADTAVGGMLPADSPGRPTIGVFLNDGVGGKLDYYLRASASLGAGQCSPDGGAVAELRITLTSLAPESGLPPYVVGESQFPGNQIVTNVILAAPTDGAIGDVAIDGRSVPVRRGEDLGRSIAIFSIVTDPSEAVTASVSVSFGPAALHAGGQSVTPSLAVTPMASEFRRDVQPTAPCGSGTG